MASTSTNKQPLLVDRVLYESVGTETLASGSDTDLNILGTNSSFPLVNCVDNDGAILEDMFVIARSSTPYTVNFYFSSASDYLRPQDSVFCGSITSPTTIGDFQNVTKLPRILAPVPATGNTTGLREGEPLRNEALYVPRGKVLWVTIQRASVPANPTGNTPIAGVQGGYY